MFRFKNLLLCFALFSLCQLARAQQLPETAGNSGLPSAGKSGPPSPENSSFWREINERPTVSPITADPKNLANVGKTGAPFQTSARIYVGGYGIENALMTVDAKKTLDIACAGGGGSGGSAGAGGAKSGEDNKPEFCKGKKEEAMKAWDAAGMLYGVPTSALMCIEAESKKDHKDKAAAADNKQKEKGPAALTDEQKKKLQPKFDMTCQKFKTMTGQGGAAGGTAGKAQAAEQKDKDEKCEDKMTPESSSAYAAAKSARTLLLELEPTLLGKGQQPTNSDYAELIKVLVIGRAGSEDEARLAGRDIPNVKVPQQYQSWVDGVMKCMGGVSGKVKAAENLKTGT